MSGTHYGGREIRIERVGRGQGRWTQPGCRLVMEEQQHVAGLEVFLRVGTGEGWTQGRTGRGGLQDTLARADWWFNVLEMSL